MKANELMIGDFVTFKDCQNDKEIMVIKIWHLSQEGNALVFIDDSKVLDEIAIDDEIVGIHITPKILEKNGFVGEGYQILALDDGHWLEYYHHEHRLTRYWEGIDEWQNRSKVRDIVFRCHCYYVHELQHALNLCGIEKTIEL